MQLSKISSGGSGVKSMTTPDLDRRARRFEHITGNYEPLGGSLAAIEFSLYRTQEKD